MCSSFPAPKNAYLVLAPGYVGPSTKTLCADRMAGNICSFECNYGHIACGSKSVTCGLNPTTNAYEWSPAPLRCAAYCYKNIYPPINGRLWTGGNCYKAL